MPGGPVAEIGAWLAALDGVAPGALLTAMTQKDLRKWKRQHSGHRSFPALRHPVARAHHVFCARILATGPRSFSRIRQTLISQHGVPLPEPDDREPWTRGRHRAAFVAFLRFLKSNLDGRTAIRIDANWCSQSSVLQGFADFILPDFVLREEDLPTDLPVLAVRTGVSGSLPFRPAGPEIPFALSEIHDAEIEELTRAAYRRDYMMFGFENWRDAQIT